MTAIANVTPSDAAQRAAVPMQFRSGSRLPIARYRLSVRMRNDLELPEYAGSMLRGQFGAALRYLSCTVGGTVCERCVRYRSCAYPAVFESPAPPDGSSIGLAQIPNPYVIEPPLDTARIPAGELLIFHMVLVGSSLTRLALIVKAWRHAFQLGVGTTRSIGHLETVEWRVPGARDLLIWNRDRGEIIAHDAELEIPEWTNVTQACLMLSTPLRLSHRGQILSAVQLTPTVLLASLARRTTLLLRLQAGIECLFDGRALRADARALHDDRSLRWREWTRFSARQRREMPLGGLVGRWALEGALDRSMPWLWLAQYLHVGKNTTFGLGKIDLLPTTPDV
jgi:hypothetical protein